METEYTAHLASSKRIRQQIAPNLHEEELEGYESLSGSLVRNGPLESSHTKSSKTTTNRGNLPKKRQWRLLMKNEQRMLAVIALTLRSPLDNRALCCDRESEKGFETSAGTIVKNIKRIKHVMFTACVRLRGHGTPRKRFVSTSDTLAVNYLHSLPLQREGNDQPDWQCRLCHGKEPNQSCPCLPSRRLITLDRRQ